MSALAVRLDFQHTAPEVLRHFRIIAVVLVAALALYQISDNLVSCLKGLSPEPIACSPPEVTLPHTDNEWPQLGQVLLDGEPT